ncbi:MAG: carbohydrate binding family 9 domain-containing protein [Mariniphaga sp.]|nr:carbohydrate binding family 9 domain-containing protein [Mariniphaga sp.]
MKITTFFIFLIIHISAFSQQITFREYSATKNDNSTINIDGKFNEQAWLDANWESQFVQYRPYEGKSPHQQTEFAIIYDKNNIYIAIKALDNQPDSITTRLTRRDMTEGDEVSVSLDTYNDKRTAFSFSVSAAGVKADQIINEGASQDNTWDPIWWVKTAITREGWNAEMCIPLTQLRFEEGNEQIWGMQISRYIFRLDESSLWQPMKREQAGYISKFGTFRGISDIKPKNTLDIIPYVVGRMERFEKNPDNPFLSSGKKHGFNAGLDAKIGITNFLTLDMTINPDFGQVEADPSKVNLSTFETFYQEKRPFFIEGKNILNYKLDIGEGEWARDGLFYSRRIGRRPNYNPQLNPGEYSKVPEFTRIMGAAKLTGKTKNGWSIGILESLTSEENAEIQNIDNKRTQVVEPLTNYLVGRIQKDFNQGNTYVGGMVTAVNRKTGNPHLNFLHKSAYAGGIDGVHKWNNQMWSIQGGVYFSQVNGSTTAISRTQKSYIRNYERPDADYLKYDSTRTSLSGYGGKISLNKLGGRFKFSNTVTWKSPGLEINDVGFAQGVDRLQQSIWASYQIYEPFFIFRSLSANASEFAMWDFGGNRNLIGISITGNAQFTNFWYATTSLGFNGEQQFNTSLRGGPSLKSPGSKSVSLSLRTNPQKKLTFQFNGQSAVSNEKDYSKSLGTSINIGYRPLNTLRFDITPGMYKSTGELQYVSQSHYNDATRYIFARIKQNTLNMSFRINFSLTPDLTIQYWGQPFFATGEYSDFKHITDSKAEEVADRYNFYNNNQISFNNDWNSYLIDEDEDGNVDYYIGKPDFNVKTFLSNLVLRWEYFPGSTVYFVWSQSRNGYVNNGSFDLNRDFKSLFNETANNIFLIKLSYRIGR